MSHESLARVPHRRFNPLTGDWVLVSPQRTERPWRGQVEPLRDEPAPAFDPACYLCPGTPRANGALNPLYEGVHVFDNDFPALLADGPLVVSGDAHLRQVGVRGTCRVLCFSPRHDLTLARLGAPGVRRVVDLWAEQAEELGRRFRWVQLFENKGDMMGCSNPHPHGQVWASDIVPSEPAKEDAHQRAHHEKSGQSLLVAYLEREERLGERHVVSNDHWVAIVPFWAVWPYETLLLPRRRVARLPELNDGERHGLADVLTRLLTRYDNLFETSFPYTMGWHAAPGAMGDAAAGYWQLHAHLYPPLLRSAAVRKFMVGYEMLSEPQRDFTAEEAAARLRSLPEVHYLDRG